MSIISYFKDMVRTITGEATTKKLIKRGLKVGEKFNRQQGCFIDPTHCWLVEIGNNVTFSVRVTILAHDASTKKLIGYTKLGKVKIGNNVFIGANATILPNVIIGNNSIVGANSIVTRDVPPDCLVAGNPAKVICKIEDYTKKNQEILINNPVFNESYVMNNGLTEEKKEEMKEKLEGKIGYII